MGEMEYHEKLKKIEASFDQAKKDLYVEYGLSQAKYKVGDIIKDSQWAIKVEKITVYKMFGFPEPVYNGVELKKDLTPRKDGNRVSIFGNNGTELIHSG